MISTAAGVPSMHWCVPTKNKNDRSNMNQLYPDNVFSLTLKHNIQPVAAAVEWLDSNIRM